MWKIELVTGMTYCQTYRIVHPPKNRSKRRTVSQEDHLSIYKAVLKTIHSMQIPYRWFAKYFYLRESIKENCKSYVKEQKLGLRVLSDNIMYRNYLECLLLEIYSIYGMPMCEVSHFVPSALRAAHIVVKRAILNVMASICPFLVKRNDLEEPLEKK